MRLKEQKEEGKMKVGIMQPYFLPYIGYWQLLNAVDEYVIYDDVNFIKQGWINRNRILVDGKPFYFNLPMLGASSNKRINEIRVNQSGKLLNKNLRTIEMAYRRAPYFSQVYPLMRKIMNDNEEILSCFILDSIKLICEYIGIKTTILVSSSLKKNNTLKGKDKVLHICSLLGATEYYNAIGGRTLYSFSQFEERGIKLNFLQTDPIEYLQFGNDFQPNLSILDVMMFNPVTRIREMLEQYTLVTKQMEKCEK